MEKSKQPGATNRGNSESYQTKYNREKLHSSLHKKRGRFLFFGAVIFFIVLGVVYEMGIANFWGQAWNAVRDDTPRENSPVLRIVREEEKKLQAGSRYTAKSRMSVEEKNRLIDQFTELKTLQAEKIRELKEELSEADERIEQLKREIVIKGGKKELAFKEEIELLRRELEKSNSEKKLLEGEIAACKELLESKRLEFEKTARSFSDANERLVAELNRNEQLLNQERKREKLLFDELREGLAFSSGEIGSKEDLIAAFQETKKRVDQLEKVVENASNAALEEMEKAVELKRELSLVEANYQEAKKTINQLTTEFEAHQLMGNMIESKSETRTTSIPDEELIIAMNSVDKGYSERVSRDEKKSLALEEELLRSQKRINELEKEVEQLLINSEYEYYGAKNEAGEKELQSLKNEIATLKAALEVKDRRLKEVEQTLLSQGSYNQSIVDMEEYYEAKIAKLKESNQQLEEQLDETEESLKNAYDKLSRYSQQLASVEMAKQEGVAAAELLQRENGRRAELEKEIIQLKEQLASFKFAAQNKSETSCDPEIIARLEKELEEAKEDYEEEKKRASDLESRLETLNKLTTTLQNELSLQETTVGGSDAASKPSKLRAKITYLTTRLAQEKSKSASIEERLQEALHALEEIKQQRNSYSPH